jgi:hypothetical protein
VSQSQAEEMITWVGFIVNFRVHLHSGLRVRLLEEGPASQNFKESFLEEEEV